VVDLYVYLAKYRTFLADQDAGVAAEEFGTPPAVTGPFSDGLEGFNWLVRSDDWSDLEARAAEPLVVAADRVVRGLGELEACFREEQLAPAADRLERAKRLGSETIRLLAAVQRVVPDAYRRFVASW